MSTIVPHIPAPEYPQYWIKVTSDNVIMFEGTTEMFRDCFFDNATPDQIVDWAIEQDMIVTFSKIRKEEI